MHQDPIADLLTRIRNAHLAGLAKVAVPCSKLKLDILKLFKENGYISDYSVSDKYHGVIKIYLRYVDERPAITKVRRVSRPSKRIYSGANDIPKALNGYGLTIMSTSKGVMTDKQALEQRVGGEVLCQVW